MMLGLSGRKISATCLAAALTVAIGASAAAAAQLYVSPKGSDKAAGSKAAPFATIQRALKDARPGDTVVLAPGRYLQNVKTVRDGAPGRPITITGPSGAVLQGDGEEDRVFEVNHDHLVLKGFVIDGKVGGGKAGTRDKLLYVIGRSPGRGVAGLRVLGMTIRNAGGECVRLRYMTSGAEIAGSRIGPCGVHDFQFGAGGKNGEGIYIGTAPEQLGKRGAPDSRVDQSNGNRIHDNTINTQGNECVDVKEGSSRNVVERNSCTGQKDKNSGGLDARGDGNIFRNNKVFGNVGVGIRFGGDKDTQGINNQAIGNTLSNNQAGAFSIQRGPQAKICENKISGSAPAVRGDFKDYFDPAGPCAQFSWAKKEKKKKDKGNDEDDD